MTRQSRSRSQNESSAAVAPVSSAARSAKAPRTSFSSSEDETLCERSRSACRRFAGAITRGIGVIGANLDDGDEVIDRDRKDILALGRRLADSVGFTVIALDGRDVGVLEHVRYEHHTDHPDELVIRRRRWLREQIARVPFDEVANVDRRSERVFLAVPSSEITFGRRQS
jgi:hypothetical protein